MSTEKITSALGKFIKGLKFKLETDGSTKTSIDLEVKETESTPGGKLSVKLIDGEDPDINLEVGEITPVKDAQSDDAPLAKYDGLKPLNG